ncbi:MAG: M17 family metallopeptidase [Rhizobiaceae bacterium]
MDQRKRRNSRPVYLAPKGRLDDVPLVAHHRRWAEANGFTGEAGQMLVLPDADGNVAAALYGEGDDTERSNLALGGLAKKLPEGNWHIASAVADPSLAAIGLGLGRYSFDRYRTSTRPRADIDLVKGSRAELVERTVAGVELARDLINTPTSDMGPAELESAVRALAKAHRAKVSVVLGDALLRKNFPLIHAVGRAAATPPRLIDLTWGRSAAPKVTLVGKGVCFDTGGLDIKPSSNMLLMKKDMGGAANVLGLASMLMTAKLDIRLRVLIPAVENAIAGNAFRPGDVLQSRKGMTVEIGNTDAEGRLILADALALADEEEPQLLIDMATLTGAARVALGPDIPPFYTDDETLASEFAAASVATEDPMWRLPLWKPYRKKLSSKVADLNNVTTDGFAGSVTAALFLQRFVEKAESWAHFDIYGWNPVEKPWSPVGGEAQCIRALHKVLMDRYG